jgi:hypothetical protein
MVGGSSIGAGTVFLALLRCDTPMVNSLTIIADDSPEAGAGGEERGNLGEQSGEQMCPTQLNSAQLGPSWEPSLPFVRC